MQVKRIVADIHTPDVAAARRFYQDVLGLELLMDHGWIVTYGSREAMSVQVSCASQGGSDTPTPDLSIEVDDVDAALERVRVLRESGEITHCLYEPASGSLVRPGERCGEWTARVGSLSFLRTLMIPGARVSATDLLERITIRPEQCGGRPCIRGIRIRVVDVLELLAAGESREQILEDFPYLEPEDISACLLYAAQRLSHPNVAA